MFLDKLTIRDLEIIALCTFLISCEYWCYMRCDGNIETFCWSQEVRNKHWVLDDYIRKVNRFWFSSHGQEEFLLILPLMKIQWSDHVVVQSWELLLRILISIRQKQFMIHIIKSPYNFSTQNCPHNSDIVQFRVQSPERCMKKHLKSTKL